MQVQGMWIRAAVCCVAATVYAHSGQFSQSSSGETSTSGGSSAWSSAGGSSSASASASGSTTSSGGGMAGGFASGSGSTSGVSLAAGKPTHAIFYRLESGNPSSAAAGQAFDAHTRHLSDLRSKGKVLLFGPWRDLPGSMAIVIAKNDDEALTIAKSDPAVKSGALSFEVRAWNMTAFPSTTTKR